MGTSAFLKRKPHIHAAFVFYLGGGKRDRTDDLLHAMQALSQLSYTPEEIRIMKITLHPVNPHRELF